MGDEPDLTVATHEPEALPPPPPPPPAPAAGGELPAKVSGVGCPSCGGALEVEVGVRVVTCPFCGTALLATSELGVRRFAVEPEVGADAAREAVRRWLGSGWNKDRRLPREAELAEAFLCFLPFFRVEADVVGIALGTEQRRRTVGSGKNRRTETYEVDVERTTERHFDRTFAAVQVHEWGVRKIDLAGDRLVSYEPDRLERLGMVFPPTRSEDEVRRGALAAFREEGDPAKGLHRVRFRFLESVREALTVVYYPLWIVRYRFRERAYQAVVDAEDGGLAYGKAPGNDLYRALALVGAEAVVCYLGTALFHFASDDGCGALFAALVFGSAVLVWGWRKFRYGGVVEEGSGLEPGESATAAAAEAMKSIFSGRVPRPRLPR